MNKKKGPTERRKPLNRALGFPALPIRFVLLEMHYVILAGVLPVYKFPCRNILPTFIPFVKLFGLTWPFEAFPGFPHNLLHLFSIFGFLSDPRRGLLPLKICFALSNRNHGCSRRIGN